MARSATLKKVRFPKKSAASRAFAKLRKKWGELKGRKPLHDPEYRRWIEGLPCAVCALKYFVAPVTTRELVGFLVEVEAERLSECAHVGPVRGMRQKCSDHETIPLCSLHHRTGPDAQHQLQKGFWAHHNLNREELIKSLNAQFRERAA